MGNNKSCCLVTNPARRDRKEKYLQAPEDACSEHESERGDVQRVPSSINVQHISERECDDTFEDPTNGPVASPKFRSCSKTDMRQINSSRSKRYSHYDSLMMTDSYISPGLKKASSCSTILIDDSTASQPNLRNTIKAVSLALFYHINEKKAHIHSHLQRVPPEHDERLWKIFDEKLHPITRDPVPSDYAQRYPDHRQIYRFMRTLFSTAQLTAECAIVTLVYIERLITYAELEICPSNWKRILLGAIMLASKVWDDQAVWNVDYCQILKEVTVEDMNELERQFLEALQFNINVPSSVYSKYYFNLRAMAAAEDLSPMLEPLDKVKARKLEAVSSVCEDRLLKENKAELSRSHSLDGLTSPMRSGRVVLS